MDPLHAQPVTRGLPVQGDVRFRADPGPVDVPGERKPPSRDQDISTIHALDDAADEIGNARRRLVEAGGHHHPLLVAQPRHRDTLSRPEDNRQRVCGRQSHPLSEHGHFPAHGINGRDGTNDDVPDSDRPRPQASRALVGFHLDHLPDAQVRGRPGSAVEGHRLIVSIMHLDAVDPDAPECGDGPDDSRASDSAPVAGGLVTGAADSGAVVPGGQTGAAEASSTAKLVRQDRDEGQQET
jgi:hypothetical protein